jgi:hypothetical protein
VAGHPIALTDMVFYLLTPHKIEAFEHNLSDFLADDVMQTIQLESTKIATDLACLQNLQKEYPSYYGYEIKVGKL